MGMFFPSRGDRMSSVEKKYGTGFTVIFIFLFCTQIVNLFSTEYITGKYDNSLRNLEILYQINMAAGNTHTAFNKYSSFFNEEYLASFEKNMETLEKASEQIPDMVNENYSRQAVDFYYLVKTYMDSVRQAASLTGEYANGSMMDVVSLQKWYDTVQLCYTNMTESCNDAVEEQMEIWQAYRNEIQWARKVLFGLQVLVLFLGIGICVSYRKKLKREFARPITALTRFAEQITVTGVYPEKPLVLDTHDELSVMAATFNEMVAVNREQLQKLKEAADIREKLHHAEIENLRISRDLKNSQYKFLQSRINPHFLFNTLNMIGQSAYLEQAPETSRLIGATADFLRYNLRRLNKIGTIGDEVENVKNYTYIQQCRYGERISFIYDVEERLMLYRMPCMILQPLVENAVVHGVQEMTGNARVVIKIWEENGKIALNVTDNGTGIMEDKLEGLNRAIRKQDVSEEHMGLQNVYSRLRMYFGKEVEFKIMCNGGQTVCYLKVPMESEECIL